MGAKRIQRRRTKGWRMPADTIYVGRPTRFGNPWPKENPYCLTFYRQWLAKKLEADPKFLEPLRGHDLACWCRPDEQCHADILLEAIS